MNRYNQQNELTPKALIYRIVITLAALIIVCLYMPRDEQQTYQFDLGKPWRYSQLIATYDFPVYKSQETIQKEQDSILQYYEPYFAIAPSVGQQQIERFKATIAAQKPAVIPANYVDYDLRPERSGGTPDVPSVLAQDRIRIPRRPGG